MRDKPFRFGIVAGQPQTATEWTALARRLEEQGYRALLVPDTPHTMTPAIACAVAAAGTRAMHVGPHVLSAPNRTPGLVASETTTLHTLTEGRYELGLGTGRPGADRDAAAFGMPFGSAGERIAALEATVAAVRQQSPDTKVMVAAGGPKMLRSAGRMADIVTFGLPPTAGRDALAAAVDAVHEGAGQRFDDIELAQNLLVVGDEAPPWTLKWAGTDLPSLQATGSVALLSGTPEEMAEVLRRRRDELSISYLSTSLPFADALAPVVQILAGS